MFRLYSGIAKRAANRKSNFFSGVGVGFGSSLWNFLAFPSRPCEPVGTCRKRPRLLPVRPCSPPPVSFPSLCAPSLSPPCVNCVFKDTQQERGVCPPPVLILSKFCSSYSHPLTT